MPSYLNPDRVFLAVVLSVNYNTGICTLSYFKPNDKSTNTVVAQPYAGRGWGMFCGIEPGTLCICAHDMERKIYIISYFPDTAWTNEALGRSGAIGINEFAYPRVTSGEIALQSKKNARVSLNRYGDVLLETPTGDRIVLDATTDTIELLSAQQRNTTEAYEEIAGVIKRDIRTLEEKAQEPFTGSASAFGYNFDDTSEIIGFNPTHKPDAAPALSDDFLTGLPPETLPSNLRAEIQNSFSNVSPGIADLSLGETGSFLYQSDSVNPPLTEVKQTFYEFGDSNVGIDQQKVTDDLKAVGKFDNNVLGRKVIGTHVNEIGKLLKFDYGFGDGGMGHGTMWPTLGINSHADGKSTDGFFDRENTLLEPKGELREDFEWTVETFDLVDAATMFDLTFRTRGIDYKGVAELEDTGGVHWFVRVAKDGLTKINIPAATSLNAKEFHREGRSLLANFDGSIEMTVGKQLCTGDKGLDRVTGQEDERVNFVNMNNYPNYGRKDRSVALDLEGNLEARVGGDNNTNQSVMLQADGSLSAFFGKEVLNDAANGQSDPLAENSGAPVSTACLANDRKDRSITVRTIGNIEAHVGRDDRYNQSIMVATEGGNRTMFGMDTRNRSLDMHTVGGIRVEVQGPMTKQGYALELDLEGNMHIYVNGKVDIHAADDMRFQTEKNLHLDVGKDLYANIGGSCHTTIAKDRIADIGGSDNVKVSKSRLADIGSNEDINVGAAHNLVVNGTSAETVSGTKNIQGNGGVNVDGGIISLNAAASIAAVAQSPSSPVEPQDIFMSDRELPPITSETSLDQTLPEPRDSDETGEPPVTEQLEETIDPKSNRIQNPFEEGT